MEIALIFTGALILFSLVFNSLFEKTRIPNVLFLLIIGLLIGPIFNLMAPEDLGRLGGIFSKITLIVILFESGTRLHISELKKAVGTGSALAIFNFLIPVAAGIAVGHYILGLDFISGAFMGACMGSISTPIILPMLNQLKLGSKAENVIFMEAVISDVVCLIGAMAILDSMQGGGFSIGSTISHMGLSFVLSAAIGLVAGLIWMAARRTVIANLKQNLFTSLAVAFILYGTCLAIGINGGMAVLLFGFVAGNISELGNILNKHIPGKEFIRRKQETFLAEDEKSFYSEIAFILKTFFFVYVGISIKISEPYLIVMGLVFILIMFVIRIPGIMLFCRKGYSPRDKKIMSILTPKGLVSAVLASLPLQAAITAQQVRAGEIIQSITYSAVLFSIIIFSIMIFIFSKKKK